jgi:hypothetical protein
VVHIEPRLSAEVKFLGRHKGGALRVPCCFRSASCQPSTSAARGPVIATP